MHDNQIRSLVFSKDGKYYLFTLIMYLCINYDLYVIYLNENYNYEDMLLREVMMDQWRFSTRKVANVLLSVLRMRTLVLLEPLCLKFEWVNIVFIS